MNLGEKKMINKYPVFIPTKGRFENPITIKMFQEHNVRFKIVIEEQEYSQYKKLVDPSQILVLPHKNEGLMVTRNWLWDYAENERFEKFWTFDDNIGRVYRWNHNRRLQIKDGTYLKVIEDFADRYINLYIIGMNYVSFCSDRGNIPAYYPNTRVYSNMLLTTKAKLSSVLHRHS